MKKFYLEIETDNRECGFGGRWLNYDTIVAEGDTLDECLENATAFTMDQDGGSGPEVEADKPWMQDLIIDAFIDALLKQKVS